MFWVFKYLILLVGCIFSLYYGAQSCVMHVSSACYVNLFSIAHPVLRFISCEMKAGISSDKVFEICSAFTSKCTTKKRTSLWERMQHNQKWTHYLIKRYAEACILHLTGVCRIMPTVWFWLLLFRCGNGIEARRAVLSKIVFWGGESDQEGSNIEWKESPYLKRNVFFQGTFLFLT